MIIRLSKSLNIVFRKSHYVKKMECALSNYALSSLTTVDYPVNWTFKSTLSAIGFKLKTNVDLLVSEFFLSFFFFFFFFLLRFINKRVRGFASHQCKFHFALMYGGLDTPYGSNNMKVDKQGSLDVLKCGKVRT